VPWSFCSGTVVATSGPCCDPHLAHVWWRAGDAQSTGIALSRDAEGSTEVTCASLDGNHRRLMTGHADGLVRLWNLSNGDLVRVLHTPVRHHTCLLFHGGAVSHAVMAGAWSGAIVLTQDSPGVSMAGESSNSPTLHTSMAAPSRPSTARSGAAGTSLRSPLSTSRPVSRAKSRLLSPPAMQSVGLTPASYVLACTVPLPSSDSPVPTTESAVRATPTETLSSTFARTNRHTSSDTSSPDVLCLAVGSSVVNDSHISLPWLASGQTDGQLILWNAISGKAISRRHLQEPLQGPADVRLRDASSASSSVRPVLHHVGILGPHPD
jgi:WD40 repeat protein